MKVLRNLTWYIFFYCEFEDWERERNTEIEKKWKDKKGIIPTHIKTMQAEIKQCLEFMNRRLVKMDWTHLVCVCKHSVYSYTYVHLICDKWGTPCVSDVYQIQL